MGDSHGHHSQARRHQGRQQIRGGQVVCRERRHVAHGSAPIGNDWRTEVASQSRIQGRAPDRWQPPQADGEREGGAAEDESREGGIEEGCTGKDIGENDIHCQDISCREGIGNDGIGKDACKEGTCREASCKVDCKDGVAKDAIATVDAGEGAGCEAGCIQVGIVEDAGYRDDTAKQACDLRKDAIGAHGDEGHVEEGIDRQVRWQWRWSAADQRGESPREHPRVARSQACP